MINAIVYAHYGGIFYITLSTSLMDEFNINYHYLRWYRWCFDLRLVIKVPLSTAA